MKGLLGLKKRGLLKHFLKEVFKKKGKKDVFLNKKCVMCIKIQNKIKNLLKGIKNFSLN